MRLPPLTADCGIGPAQGTYMRVAMPGSASPGYAAPSPAARWSLVPQMMADLNDLADAATAEATTIEQNYKTKNAYTSLCPGQKTCWGKKAFARNYICCDLTTEKCGYNADDSAACVPTKGSS